jgi:hypothetical protein
MTPTVERQIQVQRDRIDALAQDFRSLTSHDRDEKKYIRRAADKCRQRIYELERAAR